jgi:hypothetical protein
MTWEITSNDEKARTLCQRIGLSFHLAASLSKPMRREEPEATMMAAKLICFR